MLEGDAATAVLEAYEAVKDCQEKLHKAVVAVENCNRKNEEWASGDYMAYRLLSQALRDVHSDIRMDVYAAAKYAGYKEI